MNRFQGFIKKEFLHILRDARSMMIIFGIPVVQILLFGYVLTNEIKDARFAVVDHSRDEVTAEIIDKMTSSGYFIIADYLESEDHIQQVLKSGEARIALVFQPSFARTIEKEGVAKIHIVADASDPNTANMLVKYTRSIIADYTRALNPVVDMPVMIEQEVRMLFNEELKGVYMFVPGTMALILMLLSAMMTSISIAREKEMGTMEVLLVSPLRPVQIILGKVTPYIAMAFINAVVIILLGVLVFEMPLKGSLTLLMAQSLLFICMSLALGILISTLAKSQQVAMFISMFALMLPTILLSGFIFPIDNMPQWLQAISTIIPARYFITIVKDIMLKGAGLNYVWKESLILLSMLIVFVVFSIRKFKTRLE